MSANVFEEYDIEWHVIPFLDNFYAVSKDGKIYSMRQNKILKLQDTIHGYYNFTSYTSHGKENQHVHKIVARMFIGENEEGYVINHKDGNKHNNNVDNLEYVTSSENNQHALDTGLRKPAKMEGKVPYGTKHYNSVIDEKTAQKVINLRNETGYGPRRLSKMLGISIGIISGILYRNNWKYCINKEEV